MKEPLLPRADTECDSHDDLRHGELTGGVGGAHAEFGKPGRRTRSCAIAEARHEHTISVGSNDVGRRESCRVGLDVDVEARLRKRLERLAQRDQTTAVCHQRFQLARSYIGDKACVTRDAQQRGVMKEHDFTVRSEMAIRLDELRAGGVSGSNRSKRVLDNASRGPVRIDEATVSKQLRSSA